MNPSTPTITFNRSMTGVVTITIPPVEGGGAPAHATWVEVLTRAVQTGFAGRDLCFAQPDPPLEWGDLELTTLAPSVVPVGEGDHTYRLAFVPNAPADVVTLAVASEDFQHGGLQIGVLSSHSESRYLQWMEHLKQARSHYPDWESYLRLSPTEAEGLFQTEMAAKAASGVEFVETDTDGQILYWYNPHDQSLVRVKSTLEHAATAQGWAFTVID
jgi:hypothetical protein